MPWFLDDVEHDDSVYPVPTYHQFLIQDRALRQVRELIETLERLTVPQQREVLAKVPAGGVYRSGEPPAGARERFIEEMTDAELHSIVARETATDRKKAPGP